MVGPDELVIRVGQLRILIQVFHIGMGRVAINLELILLHILAVVAFAIGQTKQTLFDNRVLTIPQGQGKAELLLIIRNSGQTVLAPTIGAGTSLVVAEVVPGIAGIA